MRRKRSSADRGQKSFKLSFEDFMKKRGGQAIINRGKSMKQANAALFSKIEKRFGVPPGPDHRHLGHGNRLWRLHGRPAYALGSFDPCL
jgi:hypothetical protein